MGADEILMQTLEGLGYPVERLLYRGKADTYFTFQCVISAATAYCDDDSEAEEITFRIDLFTRYNFGQLLRRTKQALKAAGFYGIGVEAEVYEENTKFFHVPIVAKYLEEGAAGNEAER